MSEIKRMMIELGEDQVEEVNPRGLSMKKLKEVFELLLDPPDGQKQKKLHGFMDLKTFRTYDSKDNVYISRSCIAEEMRWRDIDRASRFVSVLTTNANANNISNLDFPLYFLEKEMGLNNTKCWRVSADKVARSMSKAAESEYFPVTEKEEEIMSKMVKEFWMDLGRFDSGPKVLWEYQGAIVYALLDNFFLRLRNCEESDFDSEENWKIVSRLLDKYEEYGDKNIPPSER
jgi:hypothetical protein